ncbi:MAG: NADP-dependent isocitrate dehydrogenase [Planctomycetota bacterium]|nr:NADP-dependent isocitrate dehydrogenase [Planctomycetota bacterium]
MSASPPTIVYTHTDEAPALATQSLLPIVRAFTAPAGVDLQLADISLAGRILAQFPDHLQPQQTRNDTLAELGALAKTPAANIIKLPNISASIPQLTAAISELREHGYQVPEFPSEPSDDAQRLIRAGYTAVLGSAVNPVLREGNSDRRVAAPVKDYARNNPHTMGAWSADSKSRVAHMQEGDFFGSEQSHTVDQETQVRIELTAADGTVSSLRAPVELQAGEVIDAAVMSRTALRSYLSAAMDEARADGVLLSLHLKATMMKVSDPILFGHAVSVYCEKVLNTYADELEELGFDARNGLGDLEAKLERLPVTTQDAIRADLASLSDHRPDLAMVDSDRGITNLHVPSDIIIDASMPAAIRASGQMWGPDGTLQDTLAMIPDRCYAGVYQETIQFCKTHGAFDVATMGNVSNVGLMAQKAQEYGSHDKTFEIPHAGIVRVIDQADQVLLEHPVEPGDIWRMCQTKDAPIRDWVKVAVNRARATGSQAIFWLNSQRAHDVQLIAKVQRYLQDHDTDGLDIQILPPVEATRQTCTRARDGLDTISVTGNVLRDYLTDLFPILELGTSAKMLSIVPLLAGGGLFETGAGGSAPKHVQQFVAEGHLRWDSLGEFLALAVSLETLAEQAGDSRIRLLGETLNQATGQLLTQNKSPSRKVNELDNRGSHFYLALYWSEALANQTNDADLRERFAPICQALADAKETILAELNAAQGNPVDLGGYYQPDREKVVCAMRPSPTFNAIVDGVTAT